MSPSTERARSFWNEQAATYGDSWERHGKDAMSARELAMLSRFAPMTSAERGLDVGIGTGRILNHYIEATPVRTVYGIDAAEAMVRTCRERFDGSDRIAGLVVADLASAIPFEVGFDVITSIRVLKYDAGWRDVVARFAQQLNPGGITIFSMPNARSLNRFSRDYGVPWYSTTHRELVDVCERSGLEVLEARGATRLPYGLYERASGPLGTALRAGDALLDRTFGPIAGVREIFIAARRNP